jgi:hypothetical protein
MLFPLPGREIVTVSWRGASCRVIDSKCSYLSPEMRKISKLDFNPRAYAALDLAESGDFPLQVPLFEIQGVTFLS